MTKKEYIGANRGGWDNSFNQSCRSVGWEFYKLDIVEDYEEAQNILIQRLPEFEVRDLGIDESWLDE